MNKEFMAFVNDIMKKAIDLEPPPGTNFKCRNCEHIQAWRCNSKVFQYCGIRKSNRTSNGLLKVKCKNPACNLFKQKKELSNEK